MNKSWCNCAIFTPNVSKLSERIGINRQTVITYLSSNPMKGDLFVDGRYTIEVGVESKEMKHIAAITEAYVAEDSDAL